MRLEVDSGEAALEFSDVVDKVVVFIDEDSIPMSNLDSSLNRLKHRHGLGCSCVNGNRMRSERLHVLI